MKGKNLKVVSRNSDDKINQIQAEKYREAQSECLVHLSETVKKRRKPLSPLAEALLPEMKAKLGLSD